MPYGKPPVEYRFKKGDPNIPHHKNKGPYLLPLLKKYLNKEINVPDPTDIHNKLVRMKVSDAIIWRRILNACEGMMWLLRGSLTV